MSGNVGDEHGRLPDFLIIGAAKSGTSTLYEYLCQHPQIYMSLIKEPCFFDPEVSWSKGIPWYRSLFSEATRDQVCGEASTNYTRWPQVDGVPARIASVLPNPKFIYIMRHPVDRAYSHYVHRHTKEVYPGQPFIRTFEEFIEEDPICLDSSNYMLQINKYLEVFPRDVFLFLFIDELKSDSRSVLTRLCRFLGVDDNVDLLAGQEVFANVATSFQRDRLRSHITEPLRKVAVIHKCAMMLPQGCRDYAYHLLRSSPYGKRIQRAHSPLPMRPETRRRLLARFQDSNRELAEFLRVDLVHWNR